MRNRAILITGAGPGSLGEALAREYRRRRADVHIVVVNRSPNPALKSIVQEILIDLNPLDHRHSIAGFAAEITKKLEQGVAQAGCCGIECLVQSAAVYDFGRLSDYDVSRREKLLGLNILGTVEVLSAALALNIKLGFSNEDLFTQVLVGARQGLQVRERRQLYASSKAWGIDLCTSLDAGGELARSIYAAPGPLDTPMLHRNHWVIKSKGSEHFFDFMLRASNSEYESIFHKCNLSKLLKIAQRSFNSEIKGLQEAMERYRIERSSARLTEPGVMTPADCARILADIALHPESKSGVYVIETGRDGKPLARMAAFRRLDRNRIFLSVARKVTYPRGAPGSLRGGKS